MVSFFRFSQIHLYYRCHYYYCKWDNPGFPIFLTFTGIAEYRSGSSEMLLPNSSSNGEMGLTSSHWNQHSSLWLKHIFLPWCSDDDDCFCFARNPRQWSQRITVSTMTKKPTRRTGTTITSVWCSRTTITRKRKWEAKELVALPDTHWFCITK